MSYIKLAQRLGLLLIVVISIMLCRCQPNDEIIFISNERCAGCQKMLPHIKQLEAEGYDITYVEGPITGAMYLPTTIIYGKKYVGYITLDILRKLCER